MHLQYSAISIQSLTMKETDSRPRISRTACNGSQWIWSLRLGAGSIGGIRLSWVVGKEPGTTGSVIASQCSRVERTTQRCKFHKQSDCQRASHAAAADQGWSRCDKQNLRDKTNKITLVWIKKNGRDDIYCFQENCPEQIKISGLR